MNSFLLPCDEEPRIKATLTDAGALNLWLDREYTRKVQQGDDLQKHLAPCDEESRIKAALADAGALNSWLDREYPRKVQQGDDLQKHLAPCDEESRIKAALADAGATFLNASVSQQSEGKREVLFFLPYIFY